jgi:hypothetical protein
MPVTLTSEEALAFAEGLAPAAHLDFLGAVAFRTAGAAVRLGVFNALVDGPLTASALARRIGTDPHATELLLSTLAGFEYVVAEPAPAGTVYGNSPATAAWLVSEAPNSYAVVLSFWLASLFELWQPLEESIRSGRPAVDFYRWLEDRPATLRQFQLMLSRLADMLAPEVLAKVPVPDRPARLLDVGGGHGRYTTAFCRDHPRLAGTVLDLPGAIAAGARTVDDAGLQDRITLLEWDITSAEAITGGPYDVALLFNIVHGFSPRENLALLRRVAACTAEGGTVALIEPLEIDDADDADGTSSDRAFVRLFSLNLFHGQGGRTYSFEEMAGWLLASGFTDVRRSALTASAGDHLILATRR